MSYRVLQRDVKRLPARFAWVGTAWPAVTELRVDRLLSHGSVVMRRLTLIYLVLSLLAFSGCCCGKRESELCSPTDIRKTHFWCFGEDAIFHHPCGPKAEFYGSEPTCWREWPTSGAEWRDGYCGPTCATEMPLPDDGDCTEPITQPVPASQSEKMGPSPLAPPEKASGPREPQPSPATGSTGAMEWPQSQDALLPRTRCVNPFAQQMYIEPAGLPRSIPLDEPPAQIGQRTPAAQISPVSFEPSQVPSLPAQASGPSGSMETFFGADGAPVPTTERAEPSADRQRARSGARAPDFLW